MTWRSNSWNGNFEAWIAEDCMVAEIEAFRNARNLPRYRVIDTGGGRRARTFHSVQAAMDHVETAYRGNDGGD